MEDANYALGRMEIDELGLDETDRAILRAMAEKFDGRPVGLETLAATVNEDANTIEDVYEPYLLQLGFIARTPRGRMILRGGYEHLGYTIRISIDIKLRKGRRRSFRFSTKKKMTDNSNEKILNVEAHGAPTDLKRATFITTFPKS